MNPIKFCISSHIKFYEKTYPIIISSLLESGVPPNDIYFFIGGYNSYNKIEDPNGINVYEVDHNSIDFTALISVLELDIYSPYWFLLHDTSYVGVNFYDKIKNYNYNNVNSVALSYDKSMNIGAYKWEWLKNNSTLIYNFKNQNYSEETIQYFKQQAVKYEDCLLDKKFYYCSHPKIIENNNNIYNTNTNRIIEIFNEVELYKIKANWYSKKEYEINL